ncbi:ester cyclase [Streptomyces sp. NBC_01304]|uniref:ester cyclase n=1 Tax=Streptomyces sp. NBC_01304 TaxID=2903818 RepID=UPI002E12DE84|nr:ester cyclase [Streptomyces sp. NBC_01304]
MTAAGPDLKARARELGERVFNEHDLTAFDELAQPEARFRLPGRPVLDREGFKTLIGQLLSAQPDLRLDLLHILRDGDRVGSRIRLTGTHHGELFGIPPTGRVIRMDEFALQRWDARGLLAEMDMESDYLSLLRQVGAEPPPGTGLLGRWAHPFTSTARFAWLQATAGRRAQASAHKAGT